jgi:hypothetical protein
MKRLAEFLEREAGHLTVALVLLAAGLAATAAGLAHGSDVVVFSLGVLARSMVGKEVRL